ncbi:MAG: ABC transporter substrate-binding protein [Armatimonadetes bacterium]|nr:ABC transporter substrate-binding protein [Armatimonadota bacterium]
MSIPLPPSVPLFDEQGALSREYLLHRGYCCENSCCNCPYDFGEPPSGCSDPYGAGEPLPNRDGPARIVSLCPSNTEILHALGLLPRVVGVDDWSDWPPEIGDLPRLGPELDIDMDRVEALHPDLVVASLSVPGMEKNVRRLQERGVPYIVLDPHSIGGIWESIRMVGRATRTAALAERLIADLHARIQQVRRKVAGLAHRPRLYWEWWPRPLFAPGGRNWLTPLSELVGGVNVTGGIDADAARPTHEEIIAADPEFILLVWTGVATGKVRPEVVRRRVGWDRIRAVCEGRIHVLEEGLFCRPSPRLVDGLERLVRLVHPGVFPDCQEAREPQRGGER